MIRNHLLVITLILVTSCATLTRSKYNKLYITSNPTDAKIKFNDSIYELPTTLKVQRSKEDLIMYLINDTITRQYIIKSSWNWQFLYGNLFFLQLSPLGYVIDLTNSKKYYYGKEIHLNFYDSISIIRPPILKKHYDYWHRNYSTQQEQIYFMGSLPWVNSFRFHPNQETPKINTGFWGISTGMEYYYKNNKFVSITGSAVMDFFIPFPAAVDFSGEVENMTSIYTSITDNYKLKLFSFGYGINFSNNTWQLVYHDRFDPPPPTREPARKTSSSIGFTFDIYHQIDKYCFIGIIYRPTLLNISPNVNFNYEHLISLDFKWKLRVKK